MERKKRKGRGYSSVAQHLLGKYNVMCSISVQKKKRKKKQQKETNCKKKERKKRPVDWSRQTLASHESVPSVDQG